MAGKRRDNHAGTYRERPDGTWEGRMSLPNGKRKSFYGRTKADVQAKIKQAQQDQDNGVDLSAKRETVAQYLTRWLKASVKPAVKTKTYEGYESIVRVRVVPRIGKRDLSKLTPLHLQELYADLATDGLAARSIRHTHAVLRRAFRQAVRWGLIARNPCDGATPPKAARTEPAVWTAEQAGAFLVATAQHPMHALYVLALSTGMRQGELLGLRWGDVDLAGGRLTVQRAVQRQRDGKLHFVAPKTAKSRRSIVLGSVAVAALTAQRDRLAFVRKAAGERWAEQDLIFPNETGGPLDPSWQTAVFKQAVNAAGLPPIRFHDLRHTAATLLLTKGTHPKIVADLLGHTSIAITLDVYSAYVPAAHAAAAATMDAILSA